ncbi:MAG: adenylyl-sulfate kinase [Rhodoblastus sp.]
MGAQNSRDIGEFLRAQSDKETLRFITCGSVDDGKSTLIGRLLYESKNIFDDQILSLGKESRQYGTQGESIDLALLVDGLQAEREQGITIDVAYRYFATDTRRFIVADTPGHEQYTRNMATGASNADVAVMLIDARKGVVSQTRRHTRIVDFMGVRHVVLAINKMDLVDFDCAIFDRIAAEYRAFAAELGISTVEAIPVSGLTGDNIFMRSLSTPWHAGPTLMEFLDAIPISDTRARRAFRMPVQLVNRPNPEFRGYCGRIAEGETRPGDQICIAPSGVRTRIKSVLRGFDEVPVARAGDSVTLTLVDEVDASRGDVLAAAGAPLECADQFECRLLWLNQHAMTHGRQYLIKHGTKETTATITNIKYREDVDTGAHLATRTLAMNEIGVVTLSTGAPLPFEPYDVDRTLGSFILIDRLTFETVGAGVIKYALRRAHNIHWQAVDVSPESRAQQKHQKPQCIWFTGLSGSGKSTIANLLDRRLNAEGRHTYLLDGDNIRHGLNRDLGFTEADRVENIRRVAEVAKLMVDAGLIVLVSFISPFHSERRMARELFPAGRFKEIYVDTPIEECERRDPKGLYALARSGKLKNFTGVDSPYEAPEAPDMHIRTVGVEAAACVEQILQMIGVDDR